MFFGNVLWNVFSSGLNSSVLYCGGLNIMVLFISSVGISVVNVLFSG